MFAFARGVNIWTRDVSVTVALRVCDRDDDRLSSLNLAMVRSPSGHSVDSVATELSSTIMSRIRHVQDEQATSLQPYDPGATPTAAFGRPQRLPIRSDNRPGLLAKRQSSNIEIEAVVKLTKVRRGPPKSCHRSCGHQCDLDERATASHTAEFNV